MRLVAGGHNRLALAALVVSIGVFAAAAVAFGGIGMPLMTPDSASYLEWSPERTAGYPLFLHLLSTVSPAFALLAPVQFVVLIVAVAALCDAFAGLMRSFWAGLALACAVFGNTFIMRYPTSIMTESLFLACLLLHATFVIHAVRNPRWLWIGLSGLMLGLAIVVRPAAYAFLLALPFTLLLWPDRRLLRTGLLALAAAVPVLAAGLANQLTRGYSGIQLVGNANMVLSMSLLLPPRLPGFDPATTARAHAELRPLRDAAAATGSFERETLARTLTMRFGTAALLPITQAFEAAPERWKTGSPYWREVAIERLAGALARAMIRADPMAFADKVIREYYALWFLVVLTTERNFAAVLDAERAQGATFLDELHANVKTVPAWTYVLKFVGFGLMFVASLVVIAAGLLRSRPDLRVLAYLALCVHAYFLLIAAAGTAVPRYMLMVWPLQCAVLIGAATLLRPHPNPPSLAGEGNGGAIPWAARSADRPRPH